MVINNQYLFKKMDPLQKTLIQPLSGHEKMCLAGVFVLLDI